MADLHAQLDAIVTDAIVHAVQGASPRANPGASLDANESADQGAKERARAEPSRLERAQIDPMIRPAGDPKFGDYQSNAAMPLAKKLRRKPRELGEAIAAQLRERPAAAELLEKVDVAGPGFVNLTLREEAIVASLERAAADDRLGVGAASGRRRVVVDYSSPNAAKEMHVGHLRSTIIGDAIARLLSFLGHEVIRQNHLGDWGTQFGMLIEYLAEREGDSWRGFDAGSGTDAGRGGAGGDEGGLEGEPGGATGPLGIGDLNRFYQQAKRKFDEDADFAERARTRVVRLQQGEASSLRVWSALIGESLEHFNAVYARLNVTLTDADVRGESAYNAQLSDVISQLSAAGRLEESQGAKVVYPSGFTGTDGQRLPLIVQKSDGGYLYATTDLAAARYRVRELKAERLIYVTDARQSQHFAMVFAVLRELGWAPAESVRLDHVPFGSILGPDRKPFKTREGGTVRLVDVLDEAERRASRLIAEKNPQLSASQRQRVARAVGVGAIKYADLSNDRVKDYVFDYDRMLAFEGNTAPYLQNAYVRIRSIFRKAELDFESFEPAALSLSDPAERALGLKLLQWPATLQAVADALEPHRLCTFLYELATAYHRFYERCPVLAADDQAQRAGRLTLSWLTARTLALGLELLGIDVVERM